MRNESFWLLMLPVTLPVCEREEGDLGRPFMLARFCVMDSIWLAIGDMERV